MSLAIKALEIIIKNLEDKKENFLKSVVKTGNRFPNANKDLIDRYNKQIMKFQLKLDKLRMESK